MKPKLIWNLGNANPSSEHTDYVYDLYYLSTQFAKDLGYQTIFYGTHQSPKKIEKWVDACYDVTNIVSHRFYDDIKVWIWYNRDDDYFTVDSDVFLYEKLSKRLPEEIKDKNNISQVNTGDFFSLNNKISPVTIRCEEMDKKPNTFTDARMKSLESFNTFNIKSIIPEWDVNNKTSLNTGIIGWGNDIIFKRYYCESYSKLRAWAIKNQDILSKSHSSLDFRDSRLSHFICEHLLYNLVNHYDKKIDDLKSNPNNHYVHLKGINKFKQKDFIYTVQTLADYHRKRGGGLLKESYQKLLSENKIPNIFYIRDRFQ